MMSSKGYKNATKMTMLVIITACLCIVGVSSFVPAPVRLPLTPATIKSNFPVVATALQAKKKNNKTKKSTSGQGFGKAPEVDDGEDGTVATNAASYASASSSTTMEGMSFSSPSPEGQFLTSVQGGSDAIPQVEVDPSIPVEERTAAILRDKYGLRTREEQQEQEKREKAVKEQRKKLAEWKQMADDGEDFDIMAMLPAPVLVGIDRFLKIGVVVCGILFIAAGIGITIEAWSKTTGNPLPEDMDAFIVNVIEPNFTPGLLVLLGFSVSLGAFAAAQLGSSSSSYREDR